MPFATVFLGLLLYAISILFSRNYTTEDANRLKRFSGNFKLCVQNGSYKKYASSPKTTKKKRVLRQSCYQSSYIPCTCGMHNTSNRESAFELRIIWMILRFV